ncbi:hypothetical protein CFP56_025493 [Quercus suber]|uniref:RNase H type-1 domain-containing protein n=1 Tax=Quercus suber TaxID=58331 RepID=A0AAW0LZM4_QUESU
MNYLRRNVGSLYPSNCKVKSYVIQQWHPPDTNIYKVNFDAAVFRASTLVSVGGIVRDNRGDPIGALSMPVPLSQSAAELEALGLFSLRWRLV